ncbi:MAG: hypothetical protein JXK07_09375 [Spirochaetes bacterium]|nr:hypothetical protein [Spirochaetota bacterium]MBN2772481.1 hypothetical protein [Spirochaetota bacterium]
MNAQYKPIPEDNTFILMLLIIFSGGLYYLWWLSRVSRLFNDNPVTNILLVFATLGLWALYLNIRYLQKSEEINGRSIQWYIIFFLPFAVLIIQNNINEHYLK